MKNLLKILSVAIFSLTIVSCEEYEPDFSDCISNFNIPVMFFYSEKNMSYSDEWAMKITSVFNKVEICKVPGTGHDGLISDKNAWGHTTLPRILTYFNSL